MTQTTQSPINFGTPASQLDALHSYLTQGTALHRLFQEAPYLPRCSDDKTATRVRPREYAIRYPYMQVNRPDMVSWLIFDLDHPNAMIWDEVGLPAPNIIVRNRQNGHSHLYYAIPCVCTSVQARAKPIAYMKAVYAAFAKQLKADLNFHSGPVAKTPGHPWWQTTELHAHVYELGTLADHVDLVCIPPWAHKEPAPTTPHSRHCILFEKLRYYAYAVVKRERKSGDFESFSKNLEAFAEKKNSFESQGFAQNLSWSSIKATVKSVARWTWHRYQGGACHRGVMQLDPNLPLAQRQKQAAHRTHTLRHKNAEALIRRVCQSLKDSNQPLTQTTIAKLAGLSRQTVAAYKHVFHEPAEPALIPSEPLIASPICVKDAVHQVSAVPCFSVEQSFLSPLSIVSKAFLEREESQGGWASPSGLVHASRRERSDRSGSSFSFSFSSSRTRLINPQELGLLRDLPLQQVLDDLQHEHELFWRVDVQFKPDKNAKTQRLLISNRQGYGWEILVTDAKWFDTHQRKGGGGVIDLVMHLTGWDFVQTVKWLKTRPAKTHQ
jgi:hypothetical protein